MQVAKTLSLTGLVTGLFLMSSLMLCQAADSSNDAPTAPPPAPAPQLPAAPQLPPQQPDPDPHRDPLPVTTSAQGKSTKPVSTTLSGANQVPHTSATNRQSASDNKAPQSKDKELDLPIINSIDIPTYLQKRLQPKTKEDISSFLKDVNKYLKNPNKTEWNKLEEKYGRIFSSIANDIEEPSPASIADNSQSFLNRLRQITVVPIPKKVEEIILKAGAGSLTQDDARDLEQSLSGWCNAKSTASCPAASNTGAANATPWREYGYGGLFGILLGILIALVGRALKREPNPPAAPGSSYKSPEASEEYQRLSRKIEARDAENERLKSQVGELHSEVNKLVGQNNILMKRLDSSRSRSNTNALGSSPDIEKTVLHDASSEDFRVSQGQDDFRGRPDGLQRDAFDEPSISRDIPRAWDHTPTAPSKRYPNLERVDEVIREILARHESSGKPLEGKQTLEELRAELAGECALGLELSTWEERFLTEEETLDWYFLRADIPTAFDGVRSFVYAAPGRPYAQRFDDLFEGFQASRRDSRIKNTITPAEVKFGANRQHTVIAKGEIQVG